MKQVEAVVKAVQEVCPDFEINNDIGLEKITREERYAINIIVTEAIMQGTVDYSKELNDKSVRKYVGGMVTNWLRKSPLLNGGSTYQVKNAGSRSNQTDPKLKALRQVRKATTDDATLQEIDKHINARLAEIKTEKASKIEINYDLLPEELVAKIKKN